MPIQPPLQGRFLTASQAIDNQQGANVSENRKISVSFFVIRNFKNWTTFTE